MSATVINPTRERTYAACVDSTSRSMPLHAIRQIQIMHCLIVLVSLSFTSLASADEAAKGSLKLVELYTSHGCSSCVPADKLLGELLNEDETLLALEFHVDYWNSLVHGDDGSFADPFSKPEFSHRQRQYNSAKLGGRPGVYTPQAIVNGRFATVGSNRKHIVKALSRPVNQSLDITFEAASQAGELTVLIAGDTERRKALVGMGIMLARYIDQATTAITGGENNNRTVTNHNIVTDFSPLGEVTESGSLLFTIATPGDNEGCVVMVQDGATTPIFAAAACP